MPATVLAINRPPRGLRLFQPPRSDRVTGWKHQEALAGGRTRRRHRSAIPGQVTARAVKSVEQPDSQFGPDNEQRKRDQANHSNAMGTAAQAHRENECAPCCEQKNRGNYEVTRAP